MKLARHPESPRHDFAVDASVERSAAVLTFRYVVTGGVGAIVRDGPQGRSDDLWQSTCFEAFLGAGGDAYVELNFGPAGGWAVYGFAAYRQGKRSIDLSLPPLLDVAVSERALTLEATLMLPAPLVRPGARLGLSVILEDDAAAKSYWALAHPEGDPDFHHPDCFVAKLP